MARVEKMEFRVGKLSLIELSALQREDSVVFAPSDQHGWLVSSEICLPTGVGSQIAFCVVENCELDFLVSRPVFVSLVDHPIVRADLRRVANAVQVVPLGTFNRQE